MSIISYVYHFVCLSASNAEKYCVVNITLSGTAIYSSLVPRPFPDSISQPLTKMDSSPQLQDKIWGVASWVKANKAGLDNYSKVTHPPVFQSIPCLNSCAGVSVGQKNLQWISAWLKQYNQVSILPTKRYQQWQMLKYFVYTTIIIL